MEIEDTYYSSLIVINYEREQSDLLLKTLIDTNVKINISMFYEKQDLYKTIKDLTYYIGNSGVDIKDEKSQDIDLVAFAHNDAKYIRREMQVNSENLYFLYIYITIATKDKKELEYMLNKIEGLLQSKSMQTKRAYFRQEQAFISSLPFMINHMDLKESAKRNVLTSGLVSTYPFISSSIFDKKGIFVGTNIYNNSLVFIDRYDTDKYKNANMCIFGTSGAGKSFYTKIMILRYYLLGIDQYIIDPDREYHSICNALEGSLLKIGPASETFINILDIREESIEEGEKGFLASKISKLIGFFNLVFGGVNEEEKAILEEKLIEVYDKKGINFQDESLYRQGKFKTTRDMPILEDLYNILDDKNTIKFKIKLLPFIKGSLKFFNNYTNIQIDNQLMIADVYELGEDNLKYGMYLFTELFWDKIKKDRNKKKSIYLDEIWRLIGVTSNKEVASFIYKIFKTIRKYRWK